MLDSGSAQARKGLEKKTGVVPGVDSVGHCRTLSGLDEELVHPENMSPLFDSPYQTINGLVQRGPSLLGLVVTVTTSDQWNVLVRRRVEQLDSEAAAVLGVHNRAGVHVMDSARAVADNLLEPRPRKANVGLGWWR